MCTRSMRLRLLQQTSRGVCQNVTYDEIEHLYHITHTDNLTSILNEGLLSHAHMMGRECRRIDDQAVQDRRASRKTPTNRRLHEYAVLYLNPRNAMMYKRKALHEQLCIVAFNKELLLQPGVLLTDRNAASQPRYLEAPAGLEELDRNDVFRVDWNDADPFVKDRKRKLIMAEVLTPDIVPARYVDGIIVSNPTTLTHVEQMCNIGVHIRPHLFFR